MNTHSTQAICEKILAQPTAPFREGWVRSAIRDILIENKIPCFTDSVGNLIAGVSSFEELQRGFRIGLMAHMDHPGFHLDRHIKNRVWQCRWYGGGPFQTMVGAKVRLFDPAQRHRSSVGKVIEFNVPGSRRSDGFPFLVEFADEDLKSYSKASFGSLDFPGMKLVNDQIKTRAADDLIGCAVALGAILDQEKELSSRASPRRLVGFFTRAEEVGFVGCLHLLKTKRLPQNVWFLSLEASKALPEAESGAGPVLRIGDSRCLFDAEFSAVLLEVAKTLQKESPDFAFQRRLMSGGMCEGTPLTVYGHCVAALAVPLLNYHNQGSRGPAPEIVSLADVEGSRLLVRELGRRLKRKPDWRTDTRREINGYLREYSTMLKLPIEFQAHAAEDET